MRFYSIVLACFTLMASSASAQCDNLFFSEYAEGGSNNKYLEIYNPTTDTIDLSGYAYPSVANDVPVPGQYEYWNEFDEGASIAPGDVYIISHGSADDPILAEADEYHQYLSNGDDGYMLVMGTEDNFIQIDAIGDWNGDPGLGWPVAGVANGTVDHTLVRKSTVQNGNLGDWVASAGTDAETSEWVVLENEDWSNLGTHSFDGCGAPVPGCTNENATNYNADATQDDGSCEFDNACNVDGVEVEASSYQYTPSSLSVEPGTTVTWTNMGGTHDVNGDIDSQTGMSFGNPEAFYIAPVSGNASGVCIGSFTFNTPGVYTYDCSIGSHAALGMVATITVGTGGCTSLASPNYNPSADFDDGSCIEVSVTSIADIQLGQETEVFTDSVVVTSGIVTGVFGSNVSIQDGQGAYSGMWLFAPDVPVAVGDAIEATGAVVEYFDKTRIANPAVVITSQGNDLPAPESLTTLEANAEAWEGVLIQVTGSVTNADLGFGEWALSDGSGDLAVDDAGYDAIDADLVAVNNQLQVTGALDYSFGAFKVQLRDEMDAQLYGCTTSGASNYSPLASIDDGSCTYEESGDCGLFFSEYSESGSSKYLELYNPTANTIFLSEYTLANCSNGCPQNPSSLEGQFDFWTFNFPLEAYVAPGGTYIISNSNDSIVNAISDQSYTYLSNGDDTYALIQICGGDTAIVDVIGDFGIDPGSGFAVAGEAAATEDVTLIRKSSVTKGNAGNWAMSAGTNVIDSEWEINAPNIYTDLGTHSISVSCAIDPLGCMDPGALNYSSSATEDSGCCVYPTFLTPQEIHAANYFGSVTTSGIVTAVFSSSFVIQNGTGPYSAIWVFGTGVTLSDGVQVQGTVTEVWGHTRIQTPTITIESTGNTLPAAELLASGDINNEQWESVLVRISGECTSLNGFGEWQLNDGSDNGMVADANFGYDALSVSIDVDGVDMALVELGANYQVTGPNYYSYDNWKLVPRDSSDVARVGCTDSSFPNYDALATIDDGSCVSILGCTNPDADNYDSTATLDDGSCVITGCTDPTALNYNENTTLEDNSTCYYTLPRVLINEIHYNPCDEAQGQGEDFDFEFVELLNFGDVSVDLSGYEFYQETAGEDQLSLTFPEGTTMAAGEFIVLVVSEDGLAQYSDNGYQVLELDAGNFSNSGEAISLRDGFGNVVNAVDYNDAAPWPAASLGILGNNYVESPDGGCATLEYIPEILELYIDTPVGYGNEDGGNWQASWVSGGTPGAANSSAFGCNNPAACNFNPNAILGDESSCDLESCYGCTYNDAENYDPGASVDNGLCTFITGNPCPADLNGDGAVSTADLLAFLVDFGNAC